MSPMSWKTALIKTLQDEGNFIISTKCAVVIYDKFPKAHEHYLVLPKEDISTIYDLKPEHLPLLEELKLLALNILEVKKHKLENFNIGFHADPSMLRVHVHVISKDFVSPCLKTKKHWNSFNTRFFRPFEDVYDELKEHGNVKRWTKEEMLTLLKCPLQCNQCEFVSTDIPKLKKHLLEHWKEKCEEEQIYN